MANRFSRRPSVAFAVTLQHQLKAYQERFEQLRNVKEDERDALLEKPILAEKPRGGKARAPSPISHLPPDGIASESTALIAPTDAETNGIPEETSIGADGQVYFYGKTSLYHIESQTSPQEEVGTHNESTSPTGLDPRCRDDERNEMGAFLAEISPDLLESLLNTYWAWPHHLHCVLTKKLFLRELSEPKRSSPC